MCPTREDITALITKKYKKHMFIRWYVESARAIWIDRERADFVAFRQAIEALKTGNALAIAPEGTRSKTHEMSEGKPGAVFLALRTGVPVVPLGIWGTENIFHDLFRFRRPNLTARFGKPYVLPALDRENREEAMRRATDEMMCRIAALIPEEYRGFYAGHPRLKELLVDQAGN
jgi:1-acyl-sn-glycerol-3-phosphate acyltransferase